MTQNEGWDSSYLSFTMATTMEISQGEFPLENEALKLNLGSICI
jgi:hypothetical protein